MTSYFIYAKDALQIQNINKKSELEKQLILQDR